MIVWRYFFVECCCRCPTLLFLRRKNRELFPASFLPFSARIRRSEYSYCCCMCITAKVSHTMDHGFIAVPWRNSITWWLLSSICCSVECITCPSVRVFFFFSVFWDFVPMQSLVSFLKVITDRMSSGKACGERVHKDYRKTTFFWFSERVSL